MKKQTIKRNREIILKPTRQYTCSRRRNKEDKKIWVVLEDGRKFYRIFKNRSMAISYFKKLKTIYAEMLVQDLNDNIFSSIVYTKLETTKRGLAQSLQDFDGGLVEGSDELFDEELYLSNAESKKETKKSDWDTRQFIVKTEEIDFSFVDDLFPKEKPLISPFKINVMKNNKNAFSDKKRISLEHEIKIYQSDLDLNLFILGKEAYAKHLKENTYKHSGKSENN